MKVKRMGKKNNKQTNAIVHKHTVKDLFFHVCECVSWELAG